MNLSNGLQGKASGAGMSAIDYGTSSKEVQALQKTLTKGFGYKLDVTGTYDDATANAVNDLRGRLGLPASTKGVDDEMQRAMKEALIPRTRVIVNGKEAWVTREQYMTLRKVAGQRAAEAVRPYLEMAAQARTLWESHKKARDDNWFWSKAVDAATGAKFPDAGTIAAAVRAAQDLESDARNLRLDPKDIGRRSAPIRQAFADMDQYQEEIFGGGEQLVKHLETIRDGCVLTLQVTSAVATGGASWQIQVGVSAGVAAYEQVLKEVDTASKTASYRIDTGVANVFLSGLLDGTVGLILKGGSLGSYLDDVAKEACGKAGRGLLQQWAIKAANGGGQQMIKDGIKGLQGLMDPKKKWTYEDFVKAGAESFAKGAGLKILGPVIEKFGDGASKYFKPEHFKHLGEIDFKKPGAEGLKKLLDKKGPDVVKAVLGWWSPDDDPSKIEDALRAEMLKDPAIAKAVKEAERAQKEGGARGSRGH